MHFMSPMIEFTRSTLDDVADRIHPVEITLEITRAIAPQLKVSYIRERCFLTHVLQKRGNMH